MSLRRLSEAQIWLKFHGTTVGYWSCFYPPQKLVVLAAFFHLPSVVSLHHHIHSFHTCDATSSAGCWSFFFLRQTTQVQVVALATMSQNLSQFPLFLVISLAYTARCSVAQCHNGKDPLQWAKGPEFKSCLYQATAYFSSSSSTTTTTKKRKEKHTDH